jgi:RHS repeat-associated protein
LEISTAVDDDWSAGYVGLYKGNDTTVHQWDDFQVGLDNNGDGDIADAGDDILVSDDFNSNQVSLSYDNNGNLTNDGVYKFEYDAWNRLRKAILTDGSDETTIGEYEYYGDNRRAKKTVSNRGEEVVENDGGNTTVLFYYDNQWRILETRNGSNQTTFQHLWGTQYTDELIWLEKNGDPTESNDTNPDDQSSESTADTRYFVHQDRNWNVVALSEYDTAGTNNGRIVERYSYTPYGSFVVLNGDSGSEELNAVSLTSTIGSPFAHQGLAFDQEKLSYQNRWRQYPGSLERFGQRDPRTHSCQDGNDYLCSRATPASRVDPLGLTSRVPWNDMKEYVQGCRMARPSRYLPYGGTFSPELLLCLFWLESSHRTDAGTPPGPYGLGQMGQPACQDVDERFMPGLPDGECWNRQIGGDACEQVANSDAYLLIVFVDYADQDLRAALRRYGGWQADPETGDACYVDPLLNCEQCLKNAAGTGGTGSITRADADCCFSRMNDEVSNCR